MSSEYSAWATVQISLTLPVELHGKLQEISDATRVPKSGIIHYLLERSELDHLLEVIDDMARDGVHFPQMPLGKRSTPKKQATTDAYLSALTLGRRKSARLRNIDQALVNVSESGKPTDTYHGGNYV